MPSIKIPTPLRAYTANQAEISVNGDSVGSALQDLVQQHPELEQHIFENGELRSFVNIFLDDEDIRFLQGADTELEPNDKLRIIPSIAGGNLRQVDQTGLKTGQALTIILLLLAFVLNSWVLVAVVAIAQLLGALGVPFAPYKLFYQNVVKPSGIVQPNIIADNPEPHRFAMFVGAIFNGAAVVALLGGASILGWVLVWIVIVLANANFWLNFCLGCWVYYQLNRFGVPGFIHTPIQE